MSGGLGSAMYTIKRGGPPPTHRSRPSRRPRMHSAAAALAVVLAGCVPLVLALRWSRPGFPWRAALGYVALTTAFFAAPLCTGALQVPTDLAYEWLPWSDLAGDLAIAGEAPLNFFQADTLLEQLPFHQ